MKPTDRGIPRRPLANPTDLNSNAFWSANHFKIGEPKTGTPLTGFGLHGLVLKEGMSAVAD